MDNPFRRSSSDDGTFLPKDYVRGKQDARINVMGLFLFGVVMLGVCGAFVVTNRQWRSVRAEQARISQLYEEESKKIEQLKELEAQREDLMQRAELTSALVETSPRSVLLGELTMRLPGETALVEVELESKRLKSVANPTKNKKVKSIKPKKGEKAEKPKIEAPRFSQTLTIVGVASNNGAIADYLAALKDCELFSSVEIEYIRQTRVDRVEMRKFEMRGELRQDADVTELAAVEATQLMAAPVAPLVAGESPLPPGAESEPLVIDDPAETDEAGRVVTVDPNEGGDQ
ncbi:MAG: PilN domain-containing protein [Planctomycetota bacterium]